MAWSKKKDTKKEYEKPETELTDARLDITLRVMECMKEARDNNTEYRKGWFVSNEFPYNAVTGKRYGGLNIMSLLADGYDDPRFIPAGELSNLYKETNGEIRARKGEKASRILFAKVTEKETGEIDPKTGEEGVKTSVIYKYHPVFNLSQLEGQELLNEKFPRMQKIVMNEFEEKEFIKDVVKAMEATGLKIVRHGGTKNFYQPSEDTVQIVHANRFETEALAYRTLLHEIGHATGHHSRCDRIQTNGFGSKEYGYEELVAELFSFYMGMETGVGYDRRTHDNHFAYLNSWIEAMTSTDTDTAKKYLLTAASKAYKGFDYVMNEVAEMKKANEVIKEIAIEPTIEKPKEVEKKAVEPKVVKKKEVALAM